MVYDPYFDKDLIFADAEVSDITLKVNSNATHLEQKVTSVSQDQLYLLIEPCELAVGLCKPMDKTTRFEMIIVD